MSTTGAAGAREQSVLAEVDRWAAPFAAAAVIAPDGTVHRHGDAARVVAVASLTKLMTALATQLAVEEGAFGLDDAAGPPGATVRDLLSHAAGLAFDDPQVIAAPRTRRTYSNSGYEMLADHVALHVGMPFEQYLREGVLEPLGMTRTRLVGTAAAGAESSLGDLVLLADELRSPALVHPSTLTEMVTPQLPDLDGVLPGWGQQTPCPWGMGPELRGTKAPHWSGSTAEPGTYGHFGGAGSFVWVDPTTRLACIVVTDRPFDRWAVQVWPAFSDAVRAAYA